MDDKLQQNGARADGENGVAPAKKNDPSMLKLNQKTDAVARGARSALSLACHVLLTGLTIYFLYVSFKTYSMFSWHPACLAIGSVWLMAEAIMSVSKDNILVGSLGRQGRIRAHWILQVLAAGFVLAGFIVEVVYKNINNRPHFVSNHAIVGLVYVILVVLTNCGGVPTFFAVRLKDLAKPAVTKLWHYFFGVATFAIGVATFVTGIYTRAFEVAAGQAAQVACTVLLVVAAAIALEGAVRSFFSRLATVCGK